ncbi:MAG TPA: hypothetical protein VGR52_07950 [Stellaceae bacterium]|nr:hypothetical protein [Stellaceae bacterium]
MNSIDDRPTQRWGFLYTWNGRPLLPDVLFGLQFALSIIFAIWALDHPRQYESLLGDPRLSWARELQIFVPAAQQYGTTLGRVFSEVVAQIWVFNLCLGSLQLAMFFPALRFHRKRLSRKPMVPNKGTDRGLILYYIYLVVAACTYLGFFNMSDLPTYPAGMAIFRQTAIASSTVFMLVQGAALFVATRLRAKGTIT